MTKNQRSKDPTEFPLFSSFPVEIQCQIYKEAFPEPCLVGWRFRIFRIEGNPEIVVRYKQRQGLLSLLLACENSKDEVFRNYEKLEFKLPTSVKLENKYGIDPYVYIRPTVDTLFLSISEFLELYELGGSMNLENITHLVLSERSPRLWGADEEGFADDEKMRHQAMVYTMISIHCPALKKLSVLSEKFHASLTELMNFWTLIDISEGCVDLDWNFEQLKRFLFDRVTQQSERDNAHNTLIDKMNNIQLINDNANMILRDFDRFLNTKDDDTWDMPGKETLKYWEKLRPVPSLLATRLKHYRPDRCKSSWPQIYVHKIELYLRLHKDGTLLNKYTGLTQLFDDAPW
ncbi:hypothetical protein OCU04_006594 [Sclerotinia nivalis]|uniref:2EXR domain-containing protein n=1 Tax=Sclerotinia nivalis TaxID=352851 RepID=A0A9X0DJT1_9HELO|nr:hypothetical protein OCU04_006594 [Sclerotinia nivalis]